MTDERQVLLLMTALSIGLLIGIERGWHGMQEEKSHAPGVRTYGLVGLLGGATGLIVRELGQPHYGSSSRRSPVFWPDSPLPPR
jgi:hypothetical protein